MHVTPSGRHTLRNIFQAYRACFHPILPPSASLTGSSTLSLVNIQEYKLLFWGWWFYWSAESPLLDLDVDPLRQGKPLKHIRWSTFRRRCALSFHWPWPRCHPHEMSSCNEMSSVIRVEENSSFCVLKMFQLSSKRSLQFWWNPRFICTVLYWSLYVLCWFTEHFR